MRTLSILAIFTFLCCGTVMAQSNRFSLGVELAVPMGDLGDAYSFGIGGTLGVELPLGDNLGFLGQAGYMSFIGKDRELLPGFSVDVANAGMIPIQLGMKYYFMGNQDGIYAGFLTGVHLQSVPTFELTTTGIEEGTELQTNFSIAPMVGLVLAEKIDLALRYQFIFSRATAVTALGVDEVTVTNSYIGLRAAYMFGSR